MCTQVAVSDAVSMWVLCLHRNGSKSSFPRFAAKLRELLAADTPTPEQRVPKWTRLVERSQGAETEYRAAVIAEGQPEQRAEPDAEVTRADRTARVRRQLSSRYLLAAARGRLVSSAEAELSAAAGVEGIPLELWDVPAEQRSESRDVTPAPTTVGVNLDPIRPAVFANSIAPMLGIEMPRVASGTYASATITGSQTAEPRGKSVAAVAAAGALTVTTATPKRIAARLELTLEDIAQVGQANFESILRENLSLALSDQLDSQAINGDGAAPNLAGVFNRLADPTVAPATVADFDAFAAAHASGVDGLWASTIKDVSIVVGPATYVLASRTFQSATNYKGEMSAAAYAMEHTAGFWTNKRMPDAATFLTVDDVQQAILYRRGRSTMGGSGAMRTAVCPHWAEIGVDDIYSGSARGERYFTLSVLLGDVILVQPDAYAQVAFKVA